MNERNEIYDRMCRLLTDYEQIGMGDMFPAETVAEALYEMLVEIQNKWETVITAG